MPDLLSRAHLTQWLVFLLTKAQFSQPLQKAWMAWCRPRMPTAALPHPPLAGWDQLLCSWMWLRLTADLICCSSECFQSECSLTISLSSPSPLALDLLPRPPRIQQTARAARACTLHLLQHLWCADVWMGLRAVPSSNRICGTLCPLLQEGERAAVASVAAFPRVPGVLGTSLLSNCVIE